ncbi:MAG: tetratricopeptide repeat protein [Moorea sp. SIO1G6]|nr:tetratricopeptide repeat protein [Moorena sp. SIO3A2]NET66601.1 tetratricopeptide repeat protein [Moorena sp. SIO1G6]
MLTSNSTTFKSDEQESYLRLKRDLSWREGFGILFVRCTPVQENLIFEEIKQDINDKTVDVLKLDHAIYNLYDLIEQKVNDNPIDILVISGLEKSLALDDYIKRTLENPKKAYQREALASLLGHLNWQRERFRDNFNCCLVFTVRKYTLRYLVRRSPDFFDWRSGVIEFPVDRDIDLLKYYTPLQADIDQEKPQQVSQDIVHSSDEYYDLLKKLLLLEYENDGDLQAIHDVVDSNADKLDNSFAKILEQWLLKTCADLNPEEKEAIADIVESLCLDIAQYNSGKSANNLEIAITGLETVLQLRPRENLSQEWAKTLNYIGAVYSYRIVGDKAQNIEEAIACYQQALRVYTFEAFPEKWAITQYNLGIAYGNRIKGEKAQNIEEVIVCYQEALRVRTFEAFPEDWAMTQYNLGNAYYYRIKGEKAQNIEEAIACYQEALRVYTFEAFPEDWAITQTNLGVAYCKRIKGEKAQNIEDAIACFQQALTVYTFEAFPQNWATIKTNMGVAYAKRSKGNKARNIKLAIACIKETMKVYTFDNFPEYCVRLNRLKFRLKFTYIISRLLSNLKKLLGLKKT